MQIDAAIVRVQLGLDLAEQMIWRDVLLAVGGEDHIELVLFDQLADDLDAVAFAQLQHGVRELDPLKLGR